MNKTNIIVTIGPASDTKEMIKQLISSGVSVIRFNLNYVDYDSETAIIIKSFDIDDIRLYYEQQVNGGRLIYCSECGKLVLIKNDKDNKTLYCSKCRKEKDVEKTLKSRQRHTK